MVAVHWASRRFVELILLASLAGIGLLAVVANIVDGVAGGARAAGVPGPRVQGILDASVVALERGLDANEALAAAATAVRVAKIAGAVPEKLAPAVWVSLAEAGAFADSRPDDAERRATFEAVAGSLRVGVYEREGDGRGVLAIAVEVAALEPPLVRGFRRERAHFTILLDVRAGRAGESGRVRVLLPAIGPALAAPDEGGAYRFGDELRWGEGAPEGSWWVARYPDGPRNGHPPEGIARAGPRAAAAPSAGSVGELVNAAREALDAARR